MFPSRKSTTKNALFALFFTFSMLFTTGCPFGVGGGGGGGCGSGLCSSGLGCGNGGGGG